MHLFPKALATAASAALLAAAPVAALAAEAHPVTHHTAGAHGHAHAKNTDKLAGPRRGVTHAINAQLKGVTALVNRAGGLDIADAAALSTALTADQAAVQADLDGVAGAASRTDLHTLLSGAITTARVARLQYRVVVAADADAAQASTLSDALAALQGQISDQAITLSDADTAALADAQTLLDGVTAQLPTVVTDVLAVSPTASRADLHAAVVAAGDALSSAEDALAQAGTDITTVQTDNNL